MLRDTTHSASPTKVSTGSAHVGVLGHHDHADHVGFIVVELVVGRHSHHGAHDHHHQARYGFAPVMSDTLLERSVDLEGRDGIIAVRSMRAIGTTASIAVTAAERADEALELLSRTSGPR